MTIHVTVVVIYLREHFREIFFVYLGLRHVLLPKAKLDESQPNKGAKSEQYQRQPSEDLHHDERSEVSNDIWKGLA